MSGSLSSVEGELNAIIKEFLEYSKLSLTVTTFEEECHRLGKPIQVTAGKSRQDERISKIKNELLQHFDSGKRTEFFSEWETHVNPEFKDGNIFCQKLEFNLHIHFAVLPMRRIDHWSKEEVDEAMVHFHYFLESRGSVLSDCSEFLPFYALPYVPHPNTHPSFLELFQDNWVKELRNKLETFLYEGLKGNEDLPEPRLIELYHHRDLDLQDARKELQYLERHIEESEKRSVLHAKKCEKLQEECRQLMAVASLLVTALENAVKGNLVDMDCVLSACTTHLPDLSRLRSESPSLPSIDENSSKYSKSTFKSKSQEEEKLDFKNLKKDLSDSSNDKKKSLILQALRWRLTKAGHWNEKLGLIFKIVDNDLLTLQSCEEEEEKSLMCFQWDNLSLTESFVRFLNALASFVVGRQYLTSNPKLLESLLNFLLKQEARQDVILDMVLGTLKKLSIRRFSQDFMSDNGAIEWLANAIHTKAPLSSYASFSSVALLFNLSLCPNGKKRCEPLKVELISGLGHLLQMQDSKVAPYVNGTLYRILSIPSVREYAKEQALPSALKKLLQKSDGEPKRQLETILQLFVTDVQIEDGSSEEEDADQENYCLELEIDLNDNVTPDSNEITGEELLSFYSTEKENVLSEKIVSDCMKTDAETSLQIKDHLNTAAASELSVKQASQLSSSSNTEQPLTPKLDVEATQLVRKIVGTPSTTLVEAAVIPDPAAVNIKGLNANEYTVAFSSRPKIPRTPEPPEMISPKVGASSPMRSSLRDFNISGSTQGIYCK